MLNFHPNKSGYLPMLPVPEMGENPYSAAATASQSHLNTALGFMGQLPEMQQNLQSRMQAFEQKSQYPSFPNEAGLGSQQPFTPAATTALTTGAGFTPWTLQGEALSR